MLTIKEPVNNIALVWHAPQPQQVIYRPMKFHLKVRTEDGLLLYNVVTSEMVLLDDKEECIFEGLPSAYSESMDELLKHHFVVPDDFNEAKSVKQLRELFKKLEPSKRVHGFTILPTMECNARCSYCFQSEFEHSTMTEEIAADVVDYMDRMCKGEPINIIWFGGEPLVGRNRISQICTGLRQKNIQYKSTMVSNAYLFDNNLVKMAKQDWNLSSVQITLDGTESIYNKTKAYVNPKDNPYTRVLRNIDLLLDNDISVVIRLNVTDANYKDLCNLIDEIENAFGGKKGLTAYSHAIYEGVGFDPVAYKDRNTVDVQTVELDEKLKKKGLLGSYSRLPKLSLIHCMADNDSTRLIYPDGTIGKCENMSSADSIGDIYHDVIDEEKNKWYKLAVHPSNCDGCCLFPECFNLKTCPEAGMCSQIKQKWKINRYTELLREAYVKVKQKCFDSNSNESISGNCNS